jgi:chromosome segregation ATPase
MSRPLSTSENFRGGFNGNYQPRYSLDDAQNAGDAKELEQLRSDNAQLHLLRAELEQALMESTQQSPEVSAYEERLREYEQLVEEKSEVIRLLHLQLEEARSALDEQANQPANRKGPAPREDDLLSLSEELERERRQIQEDEAALMEQHRQMEMSMSRERAEMARQRNDLQRLFGEIRHELERLERNGALQSKMEDLKAKLQDVSTRRGSAPATASRPQSSAALPAVGSQAPAPQPGPSRGSLMGRLFGGGK